MEHDICKFIPVKEVKESIHTVHFVYETGARNKCVKNNFYTMGLVAEGEGVLHTPTGDADLVRGDIFFLFPNVSYTIEAVTGDFKYMYITYMGIRAGEAMEKLRISRDNFLFHGFEHLVFTWKTGVNLGNEVSQFSSEGVLLMSFAAIGNGTIPAGDNKTGTLKTVTNIKNYIDDNFSDPDLSLEKISSELFYNKKYASHVFKSEMHMGFSDYVNVVRIQHACTMMKRGMTSVKDIAAICGFHDALYFSKIFKQKMRMTPTEYIKNR